MAVVYAMARALLLVTGIAFAAQGNIQADICCCSFQLHKPQGKCSVGRTLAEDDMVVRAEAGMDKTAHVMPHLVFLLVPAVGREMFAIESGYFIRLKVAFQYDLTMCFAACQSS